MRAFINIKTQIVHIVSFDVPYPADYGGAIDVFYKIKALHDTGIHVILHCFEYGRKPSDELSALCAKVYYYKRQMSFLSLFRNLPFIVGTRNSPELLKHLSQDDYPILFEGLHSTLYLTHPGLQHRKRIVRTHNIEHDYYFNLSHAERRFFQRLYLTWEARKLRQYESVLAHASGIAAISLNDKNHFATINSNSHVISAFHRNATVTSLGGKGDFVLYHGNLGVAENYDAAIYLIKEVFEKSSHRLIIAGNHAPEHLKILCEKYPNVELIENINTEEIIQLIKDAQINILVTKQATGIKLKLLAALFNGRFCVVNNEMVVDTGLEKYCLQGNNAVELRELVDTCMSKEFCNMDLQKRKELENSSFSNSYNVDKLVQLLFN